MVTRRAEQPMDLVAMTDKIADAIRSLRERHAKLKDEIFHVQRLGWVEATPHYRDGKYLYLIHPMQNRERQREYIGSDPEKIQDALDRIERKKEYDALNEKLADIDFALTQIQAHLFRAFDAAYKPKW